MFDQKVKEKKKAELVGRVGPERNPTRNCFGFISSSFARLVDLWTTAARGIQGDYCCQATADLNQGA